MERPAALDYVNALYTHLLKRRPAEAEQEHWVNALLSGMPAELVFNRFINSREYTGRQHIQPAFPAGHFHSPVVDPATLGDYLQRSRETELPGIALAGPDMEAFWRQHADTIRATPFGPAAEPARRYHYDNPVFSYGDAITLRVMISALRPRRIIEIGSGFSSACTLDTADELGLHDLALTCIEPDPGRLRQLLHPGDEHRIRLLEQPVQAVPLPEFDALEANDILFIDSTHVLKTGSDVHYELFAILPRLRPGVAVQIHDIHYPFEYPDEWIVGRNYSWNEVYAVRALLMYSSAFRILFWNSFFVAQYRELVAGTFPDFLKNPGGSLWLLRV